ncbi:hypothetical protein [Hydrogenophaga sp.]|uniref:hypothetical protein n=1 Tax=Hydrogenophaga sp. TaxID=1904254 RepID=UPI0026067173|nr:hypothetical protein [Hydrogenophaga sp.]MCW5653719.1 hypothetical protein [Hydrogenophaga sp.]
MSTRTLLPLSALALGVLLAAPALAQQTAPAESAPQATSPRDRIERITHEDALTRIDELRVGGQTQSIAVQPKNGAPAYQINTDPSSSATGDVGGQRTGNAGRSSWRVLSF